RAVGARSRAGGGARRRGRRPAAPRRGPAALAAVPVRDAGRRPPRRGIAVAWQLHYTSAPSGPTGRAGFQFVAETPGLPEEVRAGVTPYLSYRPPPDAPPAPDDAELAAFPVSLLYDRLDGPPLLLWCRYLGRAYPGRYGNFFAHAGIAEPDELEGLRPAELWHAPHWTHLPHPGTTVLDPLDELVPGA